MSGPAQSHRPVLKPVGTGDADAGANSNNSIRTCAAAEESRVIEAASGISSGGGGEGMPTATAAANRTSRNFGDDPRTDTSAILQQPPSVHSSSPATTRPPRQQASTHPASVTDAYRDTASLPSSPRPHFPSFAPDVSRVCDSATAPVTPTITPAPTVDHTLAARLGGSNTGMTRPSKSGPPSRRQSSDATPASSSSGKHRGRRSIQISLPSPMGDAGPSSSYTSALSPTLKHAPEDNKPAHHVHSPLVAAAVAMHRRPSSSSSAAGIASAPRRQSSLVHDTTALSSPTLRSRSNSVTGSPQPYHRSSVGSGSGPSTPITRGWLGNRLTAPPAAQKDHLSDDERGNPAEPDADLDLELDELELGTSYGTQNGVESAVYSSTPASPVHHPLLERTTRDNYWMGSGDGHAHESSSGAGSSRSTSSPRTSMSLSDQGWRGGGDVAPSYSDSSEGEDVDGASGWYKSSHRPTKAGVRPATRQSRTRLLPIGTRRRWAWLISPVRDLLGSPQRGQYEKVPTGGRRPRGRGRGARADSSSITEKAAAYVRAEPWMVTLCFVLFAMFGTLLGLTIKYILDPDKTALAWREYATETYPTLFSIQDPIDVSPGWLPPLTVLKPVTSEHRLWPYPGHDYAPFSSNIQGGSRVDDLEPTTVYIAVFTYDKAVARRNLIRETYNTHPRSRRPNTKGVRLRFVMGRPRDEYKQAIEKESEYFGDIVVLDMEENMNNGKTHTYFKWAADNAMVPDYEYPSHPRTPESAARFAEIRASGREPEPILHGEKRPDYIGKADDDAFLMLGELERHLRVAPRSNAFWGYLVRERFMAGECYLLSRDLTEWVRDTPELENHVVGKEDKLVSQWLRLHPQRGDIVWVSEKTWVYDHPRSGTVYAHGFLFPDEVARSRAKRAEGLTDEERLARSWFRVSIDAFSTVCRWGLKYRPPLRGLSRAEQVEALVEGSAMSKLRDDDAARRAHTRDNLADRVDDIMAHQPTFLDRFRGDPLERGGTVLVHFIKKDAWFQETSNALLGMAPRTRDVVDDESHRLRDAEPEPEPEIQPEPQSEPQHAPGDGRRSRVRIRVRVAAV